jgi:hypothetical protein
MKKLALYFAAACLVFSFFCQGVSAQPSKDYLFNMLDILVDETLMAYNSDDYIKFYEYFAKKMEPVTAEQHFRAVYSNGYKKDLGDFISRKILLEKSSLDPDFPLLVYEAEFKNYKKVYVTVNFLKEYGNYRISRMEMDKIYNEE